MKRLSLNRNQLKYVVIAAMLIDHIAYSFVPEESVLGQIMHFIGRLTGPTMAFFIAEGYQHTRNVKKYAKRLGIFTLVSAVPYILFGCGTLPIMIYRGNVKAEYLYKYIASSNITIQVIPSLGVIYSLLIALLAIWFWDKAKCPKGLKVLGVLGFTALSLFGDWPIFDVLFALNFYINKEHTKIKWFIYCICAVLSGLIFNGFAWTSLFNLGLFVVPFLIQFCYNGESGSKKPFHKWFFYVFYPAHLMILFLIKQIIC